jgi:uncharacterized protein (TIGR02001 family)
MNNFDVLTGAVRAGFVGVAALMATAGVANAADVYDESLKDDGYVEVAPGLTYSVSGGLVTDYVFRGFSQTDNDPGVYAGAEFAYSMFYFGVWAASVDFADSELEVDFYGGIKKSYRGFDFDFGVLYYTYPGDDTAAELDFIEFKAAAGTTIETFALTGTVFYTPENTGETGAVWTFEGKASTPLPVFDLSLSGTLGTVTGDEIDDYSYWNVGLSKTVLEKFTLDVRYWDTDVDGNSLADERVVGTIGFAY